MPIYDFKCRECGRVAEFLLSSFSDDAGIACPSCGGQNMQRLISAPRLLKSDSAARGETCCGRGERCESPPCSADGQCHRHQGVR
jgi:putative FmdB family regulatory protein